MNGNLTANTHQLAHSQSLIYYIVGIAPDMIQIVKNDKTI
jgi:hypothetical protein